MNNRLENFKIFIEKSLKQLIFHKEIAEECDIEKNLIENYDKVILLTNSLIEISEKYNFSINYINQYTQSINNLVSQLPFQGQTNLKFLEYNKSHFKTNIENYLKSIYSQYESLNFNIDFFKKINFFTSNVVAIGANGSGKTTLSNKFKAYLQNNGVVISAQRVLLVPKIQAIYNPQQTGPELKKYQQIDKTNKNANNFSYLQSEFEIVLKNLLSENNFIGNDYRKKSKIESDSGTSISKPPITNLDKTFDIWNSLIEHRKIDCNDGMNITLEFNSVTQYPIVQMSDGEKVMLFLIAQVLQAPKDGFIIVDEPEMYLHKTILKKLWDRLEFERPDCLFIYLTHDLDFATSRTTSKKIWIKSFTYPDTWEIENIPDNEIPETLLFELLGSRKNILFCEGEKGSIDEKIYNILFPHFTITPVGNCFQVINHTKAFNKIPNVNIKSIGIIDTDYHTEERIKSIKKENIYSYRVSEPENLLLDEDFLTRLSETILTDKSKIEKIKKEIIKELTTKKELQIANYLSNKVNYYFQNSHVKKGNELSSIIDNLQTFVNVVKLTDWYSEREKELNEIIESENYQLILSIFNDKGLKKIANKHFEISNFTERAIKLLQNDSSTHKLLKKYFPAEIRE
jgi:ABC-type cobalamin/Fe3+-siderophores transport system ATPase subunit